MNLNASIEKLLAGRWIAGYYLEDAVERTKAFNSKGISTIINFLGENVSERKDIIKSVDVYLNLIKEINRQKLDAAISIKPTEIGLLISYKKFLANYLKLVRSSKNNNVFVWLDMEEPEYVTKTINAYKTAAKYGNTGICIQSYLKRSEADILNIIEYKGVIRLVKGAYKVKTNEVFNSKRASNHNYAQLMKLLFKKSSKFTIATHDSRLIEEAIILNKTYKRKVTFAMLNGIRNKYAKHLAGHGQNVSVYVPFGADWIGYGLRRLTEEGHLSLIIRSLFEKQTL
ncbi:MAG: proline dehydrogenase family protein [Candidatus Micrarchaeaceae archaeon]|jgi:proline dehydrogenase